MSQNNLLDKEFSVGIGESIVSLAGHVIIQPFLFPRFFIKRHCRKGGINILLARSDRAFELAVKAKVTVVRAKGMFACLCAFEISLNFILECVCLRPFWLRDSMPVTLLNKSMCR